MRLRFAVGVAVVLAAMLLALPAASFAEPLTLHYDLTDLGGGLHQYDFTLLLDNHDNSWTSGNSWDWIVFGDRLWSYSGPDAIPNDWSWISSDPGLRRVYSTGGHEGPTVWIGVELSLPGWTPSSVGDALHWSGTTTRFLPDGHLRWSSLIWGGGASEVYSAPAVEDGVEEEIVPEPASLLLVGTGLVGLRAWRRRRK